MKPNNEIKLRATYAALYAVAATVPAEGIRVRDLGKALGGHLDSETFVGLILELERRKIVINSTTEATIRRGAEYADGLERLRLAGENLRQ